VNNGGGFNGDSAPAPGQSQAPVSVQPLSVHSQPAAVFGSDAAGAPGATGFNPAGMPGASPLAGGQVHQTDPFAAPAPMPAQPAYDAAAVSAAAQNSNPAVADDGDLIEKEWVNKAKAVVEKTRHDPFTQNREFGKLKADYLQKRYGKQLKTEP